MGYFLCMLHKVAQRYCARPLVTSITTGEQVSQGVPTRVIHAVQSYGFNKTPTIPARTPPKGTKLFESYFERYRAVFGVILISLKEKLGAQPGFLNVSLGAFTIFCLPLRALLIFFSKIFLQLAAVFSKCYGGFPLQTKAGIFAFLKLRSATVRLELGPPFFQKSFFVSQVVVMRYFFSGERHV